MNPLELNKSNSFNDFMEYLKWAIKSNEGYSIKNFLYEEVPQNMKYSDVKISLIKSKDEKLKDFGYQISVVIQGDINIIDIRQFKFNDEKAIQKELEDIRQGVELIAENYEENDIKEMKTEEIMEMIHNRSSIRILKKKKVPTQYETSVMVDAEQIELEPRIHFKIDKPTGIIDVDEEDLKSELDKLGIVSVMDNIIRLKVIDLDTAEEKTEDVDMSQLFKGYSEFVKYVNELHITDSVGNYLVKLLYHMGPSVIGQFVSIINNEYKNYIVKGKEDALKKEQEKLEVKKKKLDQREKELNQQSKGKSTGSTTNMKTSKINADITKTLEEVRGKSTHTRTVPSYGKKKTVSKKEEEEPKTEPLKESVPVQSSSTIPMNAFPGEQSNTTKGINVVDNDLNATEKEKDEFKPREYGLDENIKILGIELKFKKQISDLNDKKNIEAIMNEFKDYDKELIGQELEREEKGKAEHINDQIKRYGEYLKFEKKDQPLILLFMMIKDQKLSEIFKMAYETLKGKEELKREREKSKEELQKMFKEQQEKIESDTAAVNKMYDEMMERVKKEQNKQQEENKKQQEENEKRTKELDEREDKVREGERKNEEEKIVLEKDKKSNQEKSIELEKTEKDLNKVKDEILEQKKQQDQIKEQLERSKQQIPVSQPIGQPVIQPIPNVQPYVSTGQPTQTQPTRRYEEMRLDVHFKPKEPNEIWKIEKIGVKPEEKEIKMREKNYENHVRLYVTMPSPDSEDYKKYNIEQHKFTMSIIRNKKRNKILKEKRFGKEYEARRENELRMLYGELYGMTVNEHNAIQVAMSILSRLQMNIPEDMLIYIINNKILYYNEFTLAKRFKVSENLEPWKYNILYIIRMMNRPELLRDQLINISKSEEIQNKFQTN